MSLFSVIRTLLSAGPSHLELQQAKAAADDKNLVDKIALAKDMVKQRSAISKSLEKEVNKCTRELAEFKALCPAGNLSRDAERHAKRLFGQLDTSRKRLEFNDQYIDRLTQKIRNYIELRDNLRIAESHHRLNASNQEPQLYINIESLQDDVAIDDDIHSDLQRHSLQISESLTSTAIPNSVSAADTAFEAEFEKLWSSVAPVSQSAEPLHLSVSASTAQPAVKPALLPVQLNSQAPAGSIRSRRNPAISLI